MAYSSYDTRTLFKRDCLACPDETPSCPTCGNGMICSLIPKSCDQCAHMVCVSRTATTGEITEGPNVGAIAGGVVGGIAVIAIATFLVWWFWIRPRKDEEDEFEDDWEEEEQSGDMKTFREAANNRASVHTVHSVASTVASRASNMIPIAFIPGVTNTTAPPVPPIPAARGYSPSPLSATSHGSEGDIFFSPGDLRNSAYSATSSLDHRHTFHSRASITPSLARESIVSDIYHDDATANPMPAEHAIMTRPNMVSVKPGSSGAITPGSGVSASNYSQTPGTAGGLANNGALRSATSLKPTTVNIKRGQRFPVRATSDASSSKPSIRSPLSMDTDTEDDDEDPHARARQSLLRDNRGSMASISTGNTAVSPFSDDASTSDLERSASSRYTTGALSAVIEEATRRASRGMTGPALAHRERDESPFSDEHASIDSPATTTATTDATPR